MAKDFKNKVIWITGASSGIGEALALAISHLNARLILSARREEELNRVKGNCAEGCEIEILLLDLSDSDSLESKTKEAESLFGQVDILVNNGGISQRDKVIGTSMSVQRDVMEVNYFGAIALTKYTLPSMVKRKSGHQVVISSAMGILSVPGRSAYAASKHALHGWYDALRSEYHDDNIKVSLICPGYVNTKISYNALLGDGAVQKSVDKEHTTGMTPEYFAIKAINAILKDKQEVHIGGFLENLGVYAKRFVPGLYSIMVRKIKPA
jgi:short-subunit dehydrogenase